MKMRVGGLSFQVFLDTKYVQRCLGTYKYGIMPLLTFWCLDQFSRDYCGSTWGVWVFKSLICIVATPKAGLKVPGYRNDHDVMEVQLSVPLVSPPLAVAQSSWL